MGNSRLSFITYIVVLFFSDGERALLAYYRKDKFPHYFEWIEGALKWKGTVLPVVKQYELDILFYRFDD